VEPKRGDFGFAAANDRDGGDFASADLAHGGMQGVTADDDIVAIDDDGCDLPVELEQLLELFDFGLAMSARMAFVWFDTVDRQQVRFSCVWNGH
jgi:hypothetical protein